MAPPQVRFRGDSRLIRCRTKPALLHLLVVIVLEAPGIVPDQIVHARIDLQHLVEPVQRRAPLQLIEINHSSTSEKELKKLILKENNKITKIKTNYQEQKNLTKNKLYEVAELVIE